MHRKPENGLSFRFFFGWIHGLMDTWIPMNSCLFINVWMCTWSMHEKNSRASKSKREPSWRFERARWNESGQTGAFRHSWLGPLWGCVQVLFEREIDRNAACLLEWWLMSITIAPCVHYDTYDPLNWIFALCSNVACLCVQKLTRRCSRTDRQMFVFIDMEVLILSQLARPLQKAYTAVFRDTHGTCFMCMFGVAFG